MYISFAYDHHKLLFVFSTPCSEQRLGSDRTSQETWWLWLGKVSAHGIAGGGGGERRTPHLPTLLLPPAALPAAPLPAPLSLPFPAWVQQPGQGSKLLGPIQRSTEKLPAPGLQSNPESAAHKPPATCHHPLPWP